MNVKSIVADYLINNKMTVREFADALNTSHATVINWRNGATEPSTDFLTSIMLKHKDWRFDFAYQCLQEKSPDVWGSGFIQINPEH